ncbi:hypothetical protein [Pseudorhodoferax sp. Leaf265]|uniref:hypothetical protein n=1 Tax=Pseudorhodoferax sp. Leaf265 TaxID=1736315 RepID=UPI0012E77440|nr:hypothetical protein [Pseudorhodoferax sp. Leaf265]
MSAPLTKSSRALAWFGLVNGAFTMATPILLPMLTEHSLRTPGIAIFFTLGIGSLVAGLYGLKAQPWAFWLLFATFLVQCFEYISDAFFVSFIGPFSLKIGWGWNSPPRHVNLNVLAIAVCILAMRTAKQLSKGRPYDRR